MNAYTTDVSYSAGSAFALPPVLVSGSDQAALMRATRTVEASGLRIADRVLVQDAAERFERQISVSAVWIEFGDRGEESLGCVLPEIARLTRDRRCGAVVSAPLGMIDAVMAQIDGPDIEVVIDGDDATRAAALAVSLARASMPLRLSDAAADRNAERLRQLSDEVGRIASTLARLSTGPVAPSATHVELPASASPDVPADVIRSVIRARRLRSRFFAEDLFADPAWDMLLDLLQAEIAQLRVPVSSLCIAAAVPATTALRWLKTMTEQGLFLRRADPHDGRRVFVELAPAASQALRRYFAEVGKVSVI
ncbi:MAG: winged helix DNA-binding protein [Sphingomicrobium sp.]